MTYDLLAPVICACRDWQVFLLVIIAVIFTNSLIRCALIGTAA